MPPRHPHHPFLHIEGEEPAVEAHRRAVGALALALLAGCSGADHAGTTERTITPATSSSPAAGQAAISGTLLQFRRDVARRRVEVRLTAVEGGLHVEGLTLVGPGLTAEPGDPRGAELPRGGALDFPVVVSGDCATGVGPATAVLRLRGVTGTERQVTVPLEDDGLVRRLHEDDCFDQELLQQAAVEVVDVAEEAGPALQVTVRLRRIAGADPVRLTRLDSNTVYDITAVGRLPTLDGPGEVDAVLRLVPARCDVHDLGESYRTSLIGLVVALGDRPPHSFVLTPEPDVRQRIEAFAVDTCRGAGD